ncbi:uroporphyrinogen-III synthase [Aestuariivirga sp.]|uniref:uroporphyrinogen-III synthase n=1 Tax=Aestuariivirga sp. TaxID=2650926 RepID=UPI00391C6128
MRIAVTRPEEDAGPLTVKLGALGHAAVMAPLLAIRPRQGVAIPALPWQAVAVTSANGIRALPSGHDLHGLRMLAVGPQSLKAATQAGFTAEAHGGDVDGLAAFIRSALDPNAGPILYLSGAETAGDLAGQLASAGFDCRRVVLYDAVPAGSLGAAETALREGSLDAVLLYSPRTARIWRSLVEAAGLGGAAGKVIHLCLSRNVAAALPGAWPVRTAAAPEEASMLALLDQIGGSL